MLGSGGDGAYHAAQFGLPYVYAHFINPENLETALDAYRSHFKPSRQCPEPKVMLATSVLVAETTEEAAYLARPRNIWATQLMQNKGGRFPTLQEAHEWALTPQDAAILPQIEGRGFTGQTDDVLQRLSDTVQQYEIDEVFALTLIPDIDARKRSYKLLAEAAGLSQAGLAAAQ
jgi:luciferase family oxidoreductase group 1